MSIIICYAIIYILEACIFSQYCQNLFSSKIQAKYKTFFFFFSYLFLFVASLLDCYLLNLFLFLIVNLLCMVIIYHLKFLTALFHSLFVTISMLLSEICIMGILSYFGSELYGKRAYFRNLIILSVISKLLYFLILQFTSFYLKQRIKKEIIFKKNTIFLNIIPLLSAFIALVMATICTNVTLSLFQDMLISISIIMLLVINIFLAWFHASTQEKNQEFYEMQILLQKEHDMVMYFEALNQQDEKQKILIHDIKRHLFSIENLSKCGDTQKIIDYIHQIIQSSDLQDSVRICDNPLLNTILFQIKQKCKKNNTLFLTDIRSGCINFLSEYDITALFSNLLDNAIDATKNISNAFIELNITQHSNDTVIIALLNSCEKNTLTNNKQLLTTKKNYHRHGYGLKSVKRVVEKYIGDSNFYIDENNIFHTTIILKKSL